MGIFLNVRKDGVISGRIPSKPSEEVGEAWQLAIEVYSNLCLGTPNFWGLLRMALLFSPFVFYGLSFGGVEALHTLHTEVEDLSVEVAEV